MTGCVRRPCGQTVGFHNLYAKENLCRLDDGAVAQWQRVSFAFASDQRREGLGFDPPPLQLLFCHPQPVTCLSVHAPSGSPPIPAHRPCWVHTLSTLRPVSAVSPFVPRSSTLCSDPIARVSRAASCATRDATRHARGAASLRHAGRAHQRHENCPRPHQASRCERVRVRRDGWCRGVAGGDGCGGARWRSSSS